VLADDRAVFSRDEARLAWRLRCRLSPDARRRFDAHGVPARRQLAILWAEVFNLPIDARGDVSGTATTNSINAEAVPQLGPVPQPEH